MFTDITSDYLLKPIMPWINDDQVTEIVLNRPGSIFVERLDRFQQYAIPEFDEKYLNQLFRLIANENHQELNSNNPLMSGILRNGSRIQLVVPPVSCSFAFAIRIKRECQMDLETLHRNGYFDNACMFSIDGESGLEQVEKALLSAYKAGEWQKFVQLALKSRKNIVISGATSSGKTTFMNACLNELPEQERLVILEDTYEIDVKHHNVLKLLAYKNQKEGLNISMQDLLQCSLRLRPDRIIVGEVRGRELLDYIAASLTGHRGAITTIHAENPQIAFIRMCQMYKLNVLPAMSDSDIYNELKQAVDIIFQLKYNQLGRYLHSVYLKIESHSSK